ncbi:hypothetical protein DFH09DRAFT_1044626 [Mycena vulgaris]|nr:hypothetical protein DFH09DRAFT_1044626 [Mycena vulgaris]
MLTPARNHNREAASQRRRLALHADRDEWMAKWPQLESEASLNQIIRETRDQTTAHSLARSPCSFCNRNELVTELKFWSIADLDISLLTNTIGSLRTHYNQPNIQSHSLHNGRYEACPPCSRCVKHCTFFKIPLYSWANGCWIGDLPAALGGLTYAEELVVARAHTTKCWAKLNSGSGSRILRQRSASGNVCIHPHEISTIAMVLPRPMSTLYDEIIVIFVSDDHEATADMFKRTPFLVRRGRILRALQWLKAHNPLYSDITIDLVAFAEYPDDDDGCVPFPVQCQVTNDTIRGQNATYTGHGIDTTEAIFAVHSDITSQIPLSLSGTFDVDNTEIALNTRKIEALWLLKAGGSFVKSSTTAETLSTRQNPNVYGMLWPTLFPYGVGIFEDPVRLRKDLHVKPIMLKSHVKHYLQLADRRFQTHISFPFAMHNIQMVRKSSFESRLAVRRAWWPNAMSAMTKIDDDTLASLFATMAARKAQKDYSRYLSSTPAESAVFELLRYVDYVTDHIEGSSAEVLEMREEILAITRSTGTMSIASHTVLPLCHRQKSMPSNSLLSTFLFAVLSSRTIKPSGPDSK